MSIEDIPVAEFPLGDHPDIVALNKRLDLRDDAHNILVDRVNKLEQQLSDTRKAHGTLLSSLLPGGPVYDRVAEARDAVRALAENPESPHHGSEQALMRLNWGGLSVEE